MNNYQIAYIPIGVPTFHLESAQVQFDKSVALLRSISPDVVVPNEMLLSIPLLQNYLDTIQPQLVVLQNITFANAAYAGEVLRRTNCPIVLWTLREPVVDGGRLRLNSLTGAYSAANMLHEFGRSNFVYVFGSPDEAETHDLLASAVQAASVKHSLNGMKMAAIGHTPQGFGFGRGLDSDLLRNFGITLEAIEARELIAKAQSYTDADCLSYLTATEQATVGLELTPENNRLAHARLYKAYKDYITENNIKAIASRCWPDFFTSYGTPVCSVLSLLNDDGIAASCEADIYGALSMYIGNSLSGKPVFFGDPVSLDEDAGTVTYWHCGMAACSLASAQTGATIGVHPNRKIGPAMDFACGGCERVTIFRVGRKPDGTLRLFIAGGEALDIPKQFIGTSVAVRTDLVAKELVTRSVSDGWEPHFAVVYGDVAPALEMFGKMMQLEVCYYR